MTEPQPLGDAIADALHDWAAPARDHISEPQPAARPLGVWFVADPARAAHRLDSHRRAVCGMRTGNTWRPAPTDARLCARCAILRAPGHHQADLVAAGLTYRQLDYWTRQGHLHAHNPHGGSGSVRTWPDTELAVARRIQRLTTAGLTLVAAARVARGQALAPGIHVHIDPDPTETDPTAQEAS